MFNAEKINNASLEEFIECYGVVKGLTEDHSHLLDLINATNNKLKEIPKAFRPKQLALPKEEKVKALRLNPAQRKYHAFNMVEMLVRLNPALKKKGAKFKFVDLYTVFRDYVDFYSVKRGKNWRATKTAFAQGIAMLTDEKLLERTVPTNKDGLLLYGQSRYSILPEFNKTKFEQIPQTVLKETVEDNEEFIKQKEGK